MLRPTHHIPQRHRPQRSRDRRVQRSPRPRPHSFHEPLDLAESQLAGVEVRAVPRQTAPTRTPALRSPPAPPVCGAPPSRSSTTICPGLGLGARGCSRYARNATPATAPVDVIASLTPSSRPMAATRLVFSPRLFGTLPTARCPGGVGVGQGHGEVEAALIHEHRPVRVDLLDPGQVPPPGLWTLFTGVDRLFFSSIPISVPSGTWWLC